MSKKILLAALALVPWMSFATPVKEAEKTEVKSIVVFGDSLSDNGNTTKLLKSLRQVDDPAFLVSPLKNFVFRKMEDFAYDYYIPNSVLMAGKKLAQEFFDIELAPFLAGIVGVIRTVPIVPEDPYWQYHFSDGKVWNENFAKAAGLNLKDENEYYNNAYGGSWGATYDHQLTTWNLIRHPILSIKNLVSGKLIPPSLGLEITAYLLNFGKADPQRTYFIFAGGNDYLNMLNFEDNYNPAYTSKYVDYVVEGITYSAERLVKNGAQKVVLFGVPDIGITPRYQGTYDSEIVTKACTWHNERMLDKIEELKDKYPEVKFTFINTQKVFKKLFLKAEQYGITNTQDACIDVPLPGLAFTKEAPSYKAFGHNYVLEYTQYLKRPNGFGGFTENFNMCSEPSKYAFWDQVHPTKIVHNALSAEVCQIMKAEGYKLNCES
jgi:phospholipase/lecithinase/hemolysin